MYDTVTLRNTVKKMNEFGDMMHDSKVSERNY